MRLSKLQLQFSASQNDALRIYVREVVPDSWPSVPVVAKKSFRPKLDGRSRDLVHSCCGLRSRGSMLRSASLLLPHLWPGLRMNTIVLLKGCTSSHA